MDDEKSKKEFKFRGRYRKRYADKFGKPTSAALAAKDHSKVMPESRAADLVSTVLAGADPTELMANAVDEIHEGNGGGPYPIGSTVKVNKPWSGMSIEDKAVSLSAGEAVSIVHTALGETGTDKMVMFPDGTTRAIVPLEVLGENIDETTTAPTGHVVPSKMGQPSGQIAGKPQGQPLPTSPPEASGSSTQGGSVDGKSQGQPAPKDDSSAQKPGSSSPTQISSITVEQADQLIAYLEEQLDEASDAGRYQKISELLRALMVMESEEAFVEAYNMVFGEDEHQFEDLFGIYEKSFEMVKDDDGKEKKKPTFKFRKKCK